jgi:hypothetical protein
MGDVGGARMLYVLRCTSYVLYKPTKGAVARKVAPLSGPALTVLQHRPGPLYFSLRKRVRSFLAKLLAASAQPDTSC